GRWSTSSNLRSPGNSAAQPGRRGLPIGRFDQNESDVGTLGGNAGLVSGDISRFEADNPADGRPGCPRRPSSERLPRRCSNMLRLQAPLPDRYTTATPEDLHDWISAARRALGERLMILGHHYQRDELM